MSEHDEQVALICWRDTVIGEIPELSMLVAYPIGGLRPAEVNDHGERYSREGQRLREEGAAPDFPDLVLFVARQEYHGLAIEMKVKGGYVRPGQRRWLVLLEKQGYMAVICRSWEIARDVLLTYLGKGGGPAR